MKNKAVDFMGIWGTNWTQREQHTQSNSLAKHIKKLAWMRSLSQSWPMALVLLHQTELQKQTHQQQQLLQER